MLAITEEENSKLSRGTSAPLYNSHGRVDGYYVVQTTMSHQLHCLVSIPDWTSSFLNCHVFMHRLIPGLFRRFFVILFGTCTLRRNKITTKQHTQIIVLATSVSMCYVIRISHLFIFSGMGRQTATVRILIQHIHAVRGTLSGNGLRGETRPA